MTSSGLPTARHQLPAGTDRQDFVDYNRALKVARIAVKALELGCDSSLSNEQMDAIAHEIGVNLPGSDKTRNAVRAALMDALTDDDPNQAFAEVAMDALHKGYPFRYTSRGRTVMLVPIPVER